MKRIPLLVSLATAGASGAYTIIYLYRWQWNRAIIAGLFFVASEVVVAAILLTRQLHRLDRRLVEITDEVRGKDTEAILHVLRTEAPAPRQHFAWLRDSASHTSVFLPVLLGAGVLASAAAWAVEHVARVVTVPVLERQLARRLTVIGVPSSGLLDTQPLARPVVRTHPWRIVAAVLLMAGAASGTVAAIDVVADRLQSRPETLDPGLETVIDVDLRGASARDRADTVILQLWASCTGPGMFSDREIPPPTVTPSTSGSFRLVVPTDLGAQGATRLVGCLNDVTLDRIQADVVEVARR